MKKNIVIFASGTGSNAKRIITRFKNNELIDVVYLISNNSKAGVLNIAERENIPTLIIKKEEMANPSFLLEKLKEKKVDWVILSGFLWKIPEYLINNYPGRIINIHPALLPKFGGKGMYGSRVHEAVIAAGEKESGITIHYINEHYDEGKNILQKKCLVTPEDDAKSLAQKVQQLEHKWFALSIEETIRKNP